MSIESQRVVVIQDATKDVSSSAIEWALKGLSLKPRDKLTLLAVLHQVNNPSTLSFKGAGKLLGYKSRVDSSSMFGANSKAVVEEVARKREEYHHNAELMKVAELYATNKVEFKIAVVAGSPPKMVAIQASKSLKATWIILDRQMKKDKKYFMDKLLCGISRMKRDNSVEQLRGPKQLTINKNTDEEIRGSNVTYDEMLPGTPDEDDLFSLELSPINSSSPSKNILDEVQAVDTGEDLLWHNSWKTNTLSTSKSSEHLMSKTISSSSLGGTETASLTEEKFSPLKLLQEDENWTNTPGETVNITSQSFPTDSQEVQELEYDDTGTQDQIWNLSCTNEDLTTTLIPGWHTEDAFEDSICSVCKNRRPRIGWQRDFTYAELQTATDGFSAKTFLSEGGFGSVYKGRLRDGLMIAVKQHKDASSQGEKEFKSEVHVLSKARHKNVVMLLGSCSEGNHRLLVYEYVCNGSLDQHISKHSHEPLSWDDRVKIALGAARGLNYLHENNIIHRDMRPNNILVTHDHEPLLGDFGLARTQHEEDHSSDNRVVGTFGYLAPEYAESGRVSTKTDVYSFGVVLLELITGLTTIDKKLGDKSLVGWARPLLKERKYPDLIDPKILDAHDVHQLFWMVRVAEKCLTSEPNKRLSMTTVVETLTYITSGDTVCSIVDFSPAHSDSVSSISEFNGSQGDEGTEQENLFSEVHSVSNSSQRSGLFSSESSLQTFTTKSSCASSSKTSSKKNEKKGAKPRIKYSVLYGEMLH
ncbi:kinase domain [Thalictrum thalictroides]|uniref:Kinase domain n=1 Tax=Thalictrum thalictroides TaxID=46969 RepID=A0A7J6VP35_THATH|nr:kinase domain [Thalictrum thalictroides]